MERGGVGYLGVPKGQVELGGGVFHKLKVSEFTKAFFLFSQRKFFGFHRGSCRPSVNLRILKQPLHSSA
jgi:hypothetical protein